jgi:uncharacterized integral membrane protein (TIGR00697 family)
MNEVLLLLEVVLEIGIVLLAYRLGSSWLCGTIIANLLLISLYGSKLIGLFGAVTNSGNVSYAAVLFAMYLLLERDGVQSGMRAIFSSIGVVLVFFSLFHVILSFAPAVGTDDIPAVIQWRLVFGSLGAFAVAQSLNIGLYRYWREPTFDHHWWTRALSLMALTQLVDTILFFNIAFFGTVPSELVFQSIFIGYFIKVAFGVVTTPLVYAYRKTSVFPLS